MSKFVEIITDFVDENGVRHVDGYTTKENEGRVIGYIFNGDFYPCKPKYRLDPFIKEVIAEFLKRDVTEKISK